MSLYDEIAVEVADAFNEVRADFFANIPSIQLLKPSESEREYDDITTVNDNWFFEYSEFREKFKLQIAINTPEFNALVITATHVKVGDDIYVISQADTIKPQGTDFTWKLYCDKDFQARHFSAMY